MNNMWIPEIFYEESPEGITGGLPFVKVPEDKSMPSGLFICETRDISNEDSEQNAEVIVHMFSNMTLLKQNLDEETYDKVRLALGLQPLKTAIEEGEKINKNINQNL